MKAIWRRCGRSMVPANEDAENMLRSIKDRAECLGSFKAARSIKQLRMYWTLMKILVEHGVFPLEEAASDAAKIAIGHVEIRIMPDTGECHMIPKSINFESLPQAEFNTIFNAVIHAVCDRWLVGTDAEELRQEVLDLLDDPAKPGKRAA